MGKRWRRKWISGLLAAALGLGSLTLSASAATNTEILEPQVIREADGQGGFTAMVESRDTGIGAPGTLTLGRTYSAPELLQYDGGDLYSQLTTRQKACYDALESATLEKVLESGIVQHNNRAFYRILTYVEGISGTAISGEFVERTFIPSADARELEVDIYTDIMAAIVALRYDRPDMMWLNFMRYGYGAEQIDEESTPRIAAIMFDFYLEYGDQTETMYRDMMASANNLAARARTQPDTYSTLKYVYDTLASWNTYGNPNDARSHIPYAALISGDDIQPVCDGYAKAIKIVCNILGIPCVTPSSVIHMWNNVKMDDGEWYNLDLTWDDQDSDEITHAYFLVGSLSPLKDTIFAREYSHTEENPFEAYRLENPMNLKAKTFSFPLKSTVDYEYIGENYPPLTFPDVKRHSWYFDHVEKAAAMGLFVGNENGFFLPSADITRAQFAVVLAHALDADLDEYEVEAFEDVPLDKWYTKAVAWAKDQGYMVGYGERFRPLDSITREEMCSVLASVLHRKVTPDQELFQDDARISSWAREAVYICKALDIVNGDSNGYFIPQGSTQRCAAAVVFPKLVEILSREPEEPEEPLEPEDPESSEESGESSEESGESSEESGESSGESSESSGESSESSGESSEESSAESSDSGEGAGEGGQAVSGGRYAESARPEY